MCPSNQPLNAPGETPGHTESLGGLEVWLEESGMRRRRSPCTGPGSVGNCVREEVRLAQSLVSTLTGGNRTKKLARWYGSVVEC